MAEVAVAFALSAASMVSATAQGRKQRKQQQAAMKQQEQAQRQARSQASSQRLAQQAESKKMRKRKPNASAILAGARRQGMASPTFLTSPTRSGGLGTTRYLG